MNRSLRIAVADDEPFMRQYFQETLTVLGHQVVAVAETGQQLVVETKTVCFIQPDRIVHLASSRKALR